MKNVIISVMSFVLGMIGGAWLIELFTLTMPEIREMNEEMAKHFDQI